jgi:hypothetical protein
MQRKHSYPCAKSQRRSIILFHKKPPKLSFRGF